MLCFGDDGKNGRASKCNYFAMMWIPNNIEDGMNEKEYNDLIAAIGEAGYFIHKLNRDCVYISGPDYGNTEDLIGDDPNSKEKFDLIPLSKMVMEMSHLDLQDTSGSHIVAEIVVHELGQESPPNKAGESPDDQKQDTVEMDPLEAVLAREQEEEARQQALYGWHQLATRKRTSFGGVSQGQFIIHPLPPDECHGIAFKGSKGFKGGDKSLRSEHHVFVFVWFTMREIEEIEENIEDIHNKQYEEILENAEHFYPSPSPRSIRNSEAATMIVHEDRDLLKQMSPSESFFSIRPIRAETDRRQDDNIPLRLMPSVETSQMSASARTSRATEMSSIPSGGNHLEIPKSPTRSKTRLRTHSDSIIHFNVGTLPALSVMNKLHRQPCGRSEGKVFNVELMGYDQCFENLDLTVDRRRLWMDCGDAIRVCLQFLFLPFFIVIPPVRWLPLFQTMGSCCRCCRNQFRIRPRCRPIGDREPEFEELNRIEQIPWDITALWRGDCIDTFLRNKLTNQYDGMKSCLFRFVSAFIAYLLWLIIFLGPALYRREKETNHVDNLLFFDCFGPLLFYGLGMLTVIWWSCHLRTLVGPKEHFLLYNKMIVHRPTQSLNEHNYHSTASMTDWTALTNLSQATLMSTFTYALRNGFLEPSTTAACKKRMGLWFIYILLICIYAVFQNVENIHSGHGVFYVDQDTTTYHNIFTLSYGYRQTFCVLSNLLSWTMLFGFIVLWETMIHRVARQKENVKTLSDLIIRSTQSEYVQLDYIDNVLSWLAMENFIKRQGMVLFSSLETPLFSLFVLLTVSCGATIYCFVEGVGLELSSTNSTFSNSALATWFYLMILSLVQVMRVMWYGHQFHRDSKKQRDAIKTQFGTIQESNLMQFLKNDKIPTEQMIENQAAQNLLSHINHNDIVPKVFGIRLDRLAAKVVGALVISTVPTIVIVIAGTIDW